MREVEQKVLSEAYQGSPKAVLFVVLTIALVMFIIWWRERVKK